MSAAPLACNYAIRCRRSVRIADRLITAAAGQPPGHDAGLVVGQVPARCLLRPVMSSAERREVALTTHVSEARAGAALSERWPGRAAADRCAKRPIMQTPPGSNRSAAGLAVEAVRDRCGCGCRQPPSHEHGRREELWLAAGRRIVCGLHLPGTRPNLPEQPEIAAILELDQDVQ
jgi:hypothetical protein